MTKCKGKLILVASLILVMAVSSIAFAAKSPVELKSTSLQDGTEDVALDTVIELEFTKNVVNWAVKENNIKSIRLFDEYGHNISLEIIMADDQLYREKRGEIKIKPLGLEKDTYYTLVIHTSFSGKNGLTMKEPIFITFKTIS